MRAIIKQTNIWIMTVSEEKENDKGKEKLLDEIMAENFQSLLKRTYILKCNLHIQKVQQTPRKKHIKRFTDTL